MPEAAVNKDGYAILRQDNIWIARQCSDMKAKTEASCEEEFSKGELGRGVLTPNRTHVPTAAFGAVNINHYYAASLVLFRGC